MSALSTRSSRTPKSVPNIDRQLSQITARQWLPEWKGLAANAQSHRQCRPIPRSSRRKCLKAASRARQFPLYSLASVKVSAVQAINTLSFLSNPTIRSASQLEAATSAQRTRCSISTTRTVPASQATPSAATTNKPICLTRDHQT